MLRAVDADAVDSSPERHGDERAPVVAVLGLGEAGAGSPPTSSAGVEVRGYDPDAGSRRPRASTGSDDPGVGGRRSDDRARPHDRDDGARPRRSPLPALRRGAIYADLNTASPALKRDIAALVTGSGARFADVALLGPVPGTRLGTPALASGARRPRVRGGASDRSACPST